MSCRIGKMTVTRVGSGEYEVVACCLQLYIGLFLSSFFPFPVQIC